MRRDADLDMLKVLDLAKNSCFRTKVGFSDWLEQFLSYACALQQS